MNKVGKQKENKEPSHDAAADLPANVPEALPLGPNLPPCVSAEYEDSIIHLLTIIRDGSAAYNILIGMNSDERKDPLMKVVSTLVCCKGYSFGMFSQREISGFAPRRTTIT